MGNKLTSLLALFFIALMGGAAVQAQTLSASNERSVRTLLTRLEQRTDTFANQIERRLENTNNVRPGVEDDIEAYVDAFENATDRLRENFTARRATAADVTEVMNYGWYVNDYVGRFNLGTAPERQWSLIRNDLNQLARYYRVSWNWNQRLPAFPRDRWPGRGNNNSRLDGTYRLNTSMSDNVDAVINRTISNTTQRNSMRNLLTRRLTPPETIAIETRGNQVTMATDLGSQVTLTADGRTVTETNNRGRSTRTTVTLDRNTLRIVTDGDRNNDFTVTFEAVAQNRLRVTRQIYQENQNRTISAVSVYDRTSETASWPPVRNPGWGGGNNNTGSGFYIPNGTQLTATLRNRIVTNVSQVGDQFTMEVTSPAQYRGAIINGRIVQVDSSGRVSGRANLSLDFDTLSYRGRTYQFAGIIDSAREADGDRITVNNEGTVRDSSQTTRTVTRAGIGAAIGALIGAITGGGQGAAIGAGIGAGAGAGTVLIQGRNNLELEAGTEFTITSTGPATIGRN